MTQAVADPEDLINFSNALASYLSTVEEETNRLNAAFQTLGETWRDGQRQSFEEKYRQLLNALQSFRESATDQIPYLRTMAEDLKTYLSR